MRVAVFGANGYVGTRFCRDARRRGDSVISYSLSDGWIDADTGIVSADLRLPDDLDGVLYLAQSPRYREAERALWHMQAVNAVAPARIAALLAQSRPGARFIYVSTGTVYDRSFAPLTEEAALNRGDAYALSKIQGEEALTLFAHGLDVTAVRPFGICGPGQTGKMVPNLLDAIRAGRAVSLQPGPRPEDSDGLRISLCHVDDAVSGLRRLFETRGVPVLNLAGSRPLSVGEIARALAAAARLPIRFETAAAPRIGDLIADVSRMSRYLPVPELDIDHVARTLAAGAPS